MLRQLGRRARHRQRALDRQIGRRRAEPDAGGQALVRGTRGTRARAPPGAKTRPPSRCPPPVVRMPACRAAITAAPRSSPGSERPEPFASPSAIAGDAGRAVEPLLHPAGDDADHARMPVGAADQQHGVPGHRLRLGGRASAASSIDASTSCRCRFTASSWSASARASTGSSQSSRRRPRSASLIRPAALMRGPRPKPQVDGTRPVPRLRHVQQRGDAGPGAPRHHLQPLADQRAVQPGQRHHVADRRQRHQVEQLRADRAPARRREKAAPPQRAHDARRRSRNATAAAHRSRRPEPQSSRFGFTVAAIGGGGPSALW